MQSSVDHTEIVERQSAVAGAQRRQARTVVPAVSVPEDVREWVDPCTLSLLVQHEVQADRFPRQFAASNPETIEVLELLTFAYASGVLASEEIAAACKTNPAFRFLSRGHTYFAEELTSFRRRLRGELEVLLTRVLAWIASLRSEDLLPGSYVALLGKARERLDIARLLD